MKTMKTWMNWIIAIGIMIVVLSGITIVFASNNETAKTQNIEVKVEEGLVYDNPQPYKIHSGDSLWRLTANYTGHMDRQELILLIMEYNEIEDSSKLQINEVIYLPDCLSLHD
jgi:hypothetical protein